MGVGKGLKRRFLVASIGLFGAMSAQALPLPRVGLSIPVTSDWTDPDDPAARYGIPSFAATLYTPSVERPFVDPGERLEYERRIKALGGLSERIQALIDCLGFVASDILERYAAAQGTAGARIAAIKDAIADHGDLVHQHGQTAGLEAAEASQDDAGDTIQSPETVQEAKATIAGLKQYVEVQQSVLNSFEIAIGAIHAMDSVTVSDEALGNAMDTLRELVGYWQMPEPAVPAAYTDSSLPVSFRR
ncbi:hypothetical protein [Rhizobium sp. BK176]|uniref:hypothetical protein n=1 Tax=Rhizobium sp. BK176 TaxID=2587071 RepID=UPI00216A44A3|nr:hypothetical protein [Rhizobium sp. BK176]MCS4090028.1 hypothetical protein [Rhizobium sp. BK176]